MNYELAKKLKDAGFFLKNIYTLGELFFCKDLDTNEYFINRVDSITINNIQWLSEQVFIPTLSELIEACENMYLQPINFKICCGLPEGPYGLVVNSYGDIGKAYGPYPTKEELFANLYLELNKIKK